MLTREELINFLYKACVRLERIDADSPDWVRAIAGANPPAIEAALEVAKDLYEYDEKAKFKGNVYPH
jgi:hypothetical protein